MAKKNLKALHASKKTGGSDDWQTPDVVLERVRKLGRLFLDPCTVASNPCGAQLAFHEGGLERTWQGVTARDIAYCNPPYSGLKLWAAKVDAEAKAGVSIIALVPARTDTQWWGVLREKATAIAYWRGRIRFRGATAGAPFPSAAFAYNLDAKAFAEAFGDVAHVDVLKNKAPRGKRGAGKPAHQKD